MPVHTCSLVVLGIFVGLVVLRIIILRLAFGSPKRSRDEQRRRDERAHWKANGRAEDFRPDN